MSQLLNNSDFNRFQELIYNKSGLNFDENTRNSLRISLISRIKLKDFSNYKQYYKYLKYHPDGDTEFRNLLTLLTINETSFFRNPDQFRVLQKELLPSILKKDTGKGLRIWSAGCSTGEEPYSLAMAVREAQKIAGITDAKVEILGTDIDKKALARASEGYYGERAVRELDKIYRKKYFSEEKEGLRIKPEIRKMVNFDYFNLKDEDAPMPLEGKWDVIFCRNVLIYFKTDLIKKILLRFYEALNEKGYLFIGYSEVLSVYNTPFKPVRFSDVFIYSKEKLNRPKADSSDRVVKHDWKTLPDLPQIDVEPREFSEGVYRQAYECFIKEDYDKSLQLAEKATDMNPVNPEYILLKARILYEKGSYAESRKACERVLMLKPNYAEAHLILGLVYEKQGSIRSAAEEIGQAAQMKKELIMAHFHLGRLMEKFNRRESVRAYSDAVHMTRALSEDDYLEFGGGFTVKTLKDLVDNRLNALYLK